MVSLLTDILAAKNAAELAGVRARAHLPMGSLAGRTITRGQNTMTILSGPTLHRSGMGIDFEIQFTRAGVDVTPLGTNPYTIFNPPASVSDPAGNVDLGPRGRVRVDESAAREALLDALRNHIRDVFGGL